MAAALEVGCVFEEYVDPAQGEVFWRPRVMRGNSDNLSLSWEAFNAVVKALKFQSAEEYLHTSGSDHDEVRRRLMALSLPEGH